MKRILAVFMALCVCLSALPACAASLTQAQQEEADAFFARLFRQKNTVGGAVIVNQAGERVYAFFYGKAGGGKPVTEDTAYKVASVTKLITAVGVMQLAEEGRIDLDQPIVRADGAPVRNPRYPEKEITLRQVMTHTSSIAPSAKYVGEPTWEEKEFLDYAPGSAYTYANLNGGILGSVIELASGKSLNQYMTERVFAPLGINAAYAATLLPDASVLSNSYRQNGTLELTGGAYLRDDQHYDDTCAPFAHYRASVGGLYISVKGLEAIGAMLANGGEYRGVRILREGSVRLMGQNQADWPGSTVEGQSPYGLNTYRLILDGVTWYGHQGFWSGRLADLFYEPESRTAVVLVMNGSARTVGKVDRAVAAQMERTLRYIAPWIGEADADLTIIDEDE